MPIDTPEADRVRLPIKLIYGSGQFAEGVKNAAFATFVLLYYNQVLGLSGTLAGLAIFIALCFDAITDPVVGSISDNFKSRWGRRHPFMYAAAFPMAFSFYFLFAPPEELSSGALFAWMTVFTVLVRGSMTLYYVPHLALGAELSDHYTERSSIVAYRWIFSVFGHLAVIISAFAIFFLDVDGQSGDLIAENYPPFAFVLAIVVALSILVSAGGTHSQISKLPTTRFVDRSGWAIMTGVLKDTLEALHNRSFRWLAGATLSSQVMSGLQAALSLYMANFFWEMVDQSKMLLLMAMPVGFVIGIAATRTVHERYDKRRTLIIGVSGTFVFMVTPVVLRLMDLFPANDNPLITPILVAFAFASGIGGLALVSANSMMADIADEHELQTGRRQEGIFFGAISFAAKGAVGLGTMISGVALDLIRFPVGAAPGEVDAETVFKLGAVYGPLLGVFMVFAMYCVTHYGLTKALHDEIKVELSKRRRGNLSEEVP